MSGFSDYMAKAVLNWLTGQTAMPILPSVWLALFTAAPADSGGGTEVSGGSYARVQVGGVLAAGGSWTTSTPNITMGVSNPGWVVAGMNAFDTTNGNLLGTVQSYVGTALVLNANAAHASTGSTDNIAFSAFTQASGSAPSSAVNTNAVVTFPQASADWDTVIAWALLDASTGGNLLEWDYLGNFQWFPTTVSSASPGVITAHAHGYANGDPVVWSNEYGGTSPTFSQSNFTGTLTVANQTTDTFTVTNSSTAVNTSATGNGMVRKILQQSIPIHVTASFAAGTLTITSA